MAEALSVDANRKWALLSFTTLELDEAALDKMRELTGWLFFTVKPLSWKGANFVAVDREQFGFETVLASCDVVVTKPGYGILSECVANEKPMVYVEREDFVEYPVLEAAVKKVLKHVHIPSEMLYAGDLRSSLEAILIASDPSETLESGGDRVVAELIVENAAWAN